MAFVVGVVLPYFMGGPSETQQQGQPPSEDVTAKPSDELLQKAFYRITKLSAKAHFLFPLSEQGWVQAWSKQHKPTLLLRKGKSHVAQFYTPGQLGFSYFQVKDEFELTHTFVLFEPFERVVISKPIDVLSGIDSIVVGWTFPLEKDDPPIQELGRFLESVKSLRIEVSVNDVVLNTHHLQSPLTMPHSIGDFSRLKIGKEELYLFSLAFSTVPLYEDVKTLYQGRLQHP